MWMWESLWHKNIYVYIPAQGYRISVKSVEFLVQKWTYLSKFVWITVYPRKHAHGFDVETSVLIEFMACHSYGNREFSTCNVLRCAIVSSMLLYSLFSVTDASMSCMEYASSSLRNSTLWIDGQSVHQWAYLWWSGITFGGPKKYAITKKLSESWFHQVMLHEMQQKPSSY